MDFHNFHFSPTERLLNSNFHDISSHIIRFSLYLIVHEDKNTPERHVHVQDVDEGALRDEVPVGRVQNHQLAC